MASILSRPQCVNRRKFFFQSPRRHLFSSMLSLHQTFNLAKNLIKRYAVLWEDMVDVISVSVVDCTHNTPQNMAMDMVAFTNETYDIFVLVFVLVGYIISS